MSTKAKPKKHAVGRPLIGEERMKPHTIRTTDAQWEKFLRIGGPDWFRAKVDAAKEPGKV